MIADPEIVRKVAEALTEIDHGPGTRREDRPRGPVMTEKDRWRWMPARPLVVGSGVPIHVPMGRRMQRADQQR